MKKYLFIINPVSGKGRGNKFLPEIKKYLVENQISYEIILTEYPGHATTLVSEKQTEFDVIVSVGGDGTLNEIINGINPGLELILGEIPIGSGNDFAHNLSIPNDIKLCLNLITSEGKKYKLCDVWQLEYLNNHQESVKKRFINNFGLGFDAQVAYINQHKKIGSGISSYIIAVFRALANFRYVDYTLTFKDAKIEGKKLLLTFGNGVSSGGGFYLTPNAKVDDSIIDITTLECLGRLNLLMKLPLALLNKVGNIKEANFYKTDAAEINLKEKVYIHTDGQASYIHTKKIMVSILKDKLKFITNT